LLPVYTRHCSEFVFLFLVLTARPTVQDFVAHLSQLFNNSSLGFVRFLHIAVGVLHDAKHDLDLGFQFRKLLQSFFQTQLGGQCVFDLPEFLCHGSSFAK